MCTFFIEEALMKHFKSTVLCSIVTLSLTCGLFSTAMAADVPAGTKLAKVQNLVKGNGAEPASLDPHRTEGVPESNILRDLMEGLIIQDADGNLIPGVAESWNTTDNTVFTFKLRKNAKWSNGDPVTAHDFVYSLQRAVNPKTASPYGWYLEMTTMKNAADIIKGTTIGEIKIPIIVVLNGNSFWLKPSAAKVPRETEIMVENTAITNEFLTAFCQLESLKKASYHRVEYPSGFNESISGVNEK